MFKILISTCVFCLICFIFYFVKKNKKALFLCLIWNISSLTFLFYQSFDVIEYIIIGTTELVLLIVSITLSLKTNKVPAKCNNNIQTNECSINNHQETTCVTDGGLCKIINEDDENIVIRLSNNNNVYDFKVKDGQIVTFNDKLTGKTIKF